MIKILNSKLSIAIALFSLALVSNCFLHHANIQGDAYGAKSLLFKDEKLFKGTLPVRVEFDSSEKAFVRDYLKRKGQNMPVTDNMVESYFSEEIVTKFRSSEYFTHNSSANMKIRVNSSLEEVKWPVISLIGSIGTLGLFPSITRTYGRIQFEIYDSKNSKSIKTFKYRVQHRQFLGTSIIIIGAFFPLMSDRFDHSLNARNFAIMRVGFQQFENDLLKELEENKSLLKNFTKDPDKVYALLPFGNKMSQDNSYENQIYTGLESQFIKSGLSIVERKKIQSLLSEIRFSNSGLTTSNRLAFGKFSNAERLIIVSDLDINEPEKKSRTEINFSIRCVEIESGKIIWSRRLSYSNSDQKSMGIHIGLSVRKLINELMTNGEI